VSDASGRVKTTCHTFVVGSGMVMDPQEKSQGTRPFKMSVFGAVSTSRSIACAFFRFVRFTKIHSPVLPYPPMLSCEEEERYAQSW